MPGHKQVSSTGHLSLQGKGQGTVPPSHSFSLFPESISIRSSSPCHDLGFFYFLGIPTLIPARSRLEEQAGLHLPAALVPLAPATIAFLWPHTPFPRSHVEEDMYLSQWFSKCNLGPKESIPSGNFWEKQILRPYHRPPESEILEFGPDILFRKPTRWFWYKVWSFAFLTVVQVMLLLLIWGPRVENQFMSFGKLLFYTRVQQTVAYSPKPAHVMQMKFYWVIAMPIDLHIVYDCFHATRAELNSCDTDHITLGA